MLTSPLIAKMSQGKPKRTKQHSKRDASSDRDEPFGGVVGSGARAMDDSENAVAKSYADKSAAELTPYTVESLQRKKKMEMKIFRERGEFDDAEVEKLLMKVLE